MTVPQAVAIKAQRFFVSGRVQGVFYRASTRTEALRLGLTGHARNLPDGRVEVLAIGEATAIAALATWLWRGPPAADVTEVTIVPVAFAPDDPRPTGFTTG